MRASAIRIVVFVSLLLTFSTELFSQSPTDYYRTKGSGNWTDLAIWECSATGQDPWIPATTYPNQLSSGITIQNCIVTILSTVQVDQLVIEQTGTLLISPDYLLRIYDGAGDDIMVNGTIEIKGTMILLGNGIVGSTGIYKINSFNQALINTMQWLDGSTLYVTGAISQASYHILNQSFYNLIWDCAQTGDIELKLSNQFEIRGTFEIINTNKWSLYLTSSESNTTININNLINSSGFKLFLTKGTGALTLNILNNIRLLNASSDIEMGLGINNVINLSGDLIIERYTGINKKNTVYKGTLNFTNTHPDITQKITVGINGEIKVVDYNIRADNRVEYFSNTIPLLISPDCVCTIESGGTLTANSITNNANNAGFVIKNGASLITNSAIPVTIERTVANADWNMALDGWHMLSSPVASQNLTTGGFTTAPYDFYAWSESGNLWLNQKVTANNITSFELGKGYFAAYDDGGTKTFTGTLNVASIPLSDLSFTGTSPYAGFHLLGNPFSSAIDWSHSDWNRNNVSEVAQVWNESACNYLSVTTSNAIIPANQGFFVQVAGDVNSLTIPQTARVNNSQSFNKNGLADFLHLRVNSAGDSTFDETIVRLSNHALKGFDLADGHKLMGSDRAPQLYTVIDDNEYASVNSYPSNNIPNLVEMEFICGKAKTYELEVLVQTLPVAVYLEDRKTGYTTLLSGDTKYIFNSEPGDAVNRFALHLSPEGKPTLLEEPAQIYSSNGNIYIANSDKNGSYKVTNLPGQTLLTGQTQTGGLTVIPAATLSHGIYIVTLERVDMNHSIIQRTSRKVIL